MHNDVRFIVVSTNISEATLGHFLLRYSPKFIELKIIWSAATKYLLTLALSLEVRKFKAFE